MKSQFFSNYHKRTRKSETETEITFFFFFGVNDFNESGMNERVIPNSERKRVSSFENFVEFSSLCVQTKLVILKPPRNDQVKKKKKKKRKKKKKEKVVAWSVLSLGLKFGPV